MQCLLSLRSRLADHTPATPLDSASIFIHRFVAFELLYHLVEQKLNLPVDTAQFFVRPPLKFLPPSAVHSQEAHAALAMLTGTCWNGIVVHSMNR